MKSKHPHAVDLAWQNHRLFLSIDQRNKKQRKTNPLLDHHCVVGSLPLFRLLMLNCQGRDYEKDS